MPNLNPIAQVRDAPLFVVPRTLEQLRAWRDGPKLARLPGPSPARARVAAELDNLAEALLAGVERHPTKFWVLKQFQQSLEAIGDVDAEAREQLGAELGRVLDLLGIGSSDGVVEYYLSRQ
jgi:predicted TIM-barrel enzyme